jgi:predicted nucleic-acid-binding protein
VVLAEITWVLHRCYGYHRSEIANALRALLEAEHLAFQSTERCLRALHRYETGRGGLADYLIAESGRDAGCRSMATFDEALLGESGFVEP